VCTAVAYNGSYVTLSQHCGERIQTISPGDAEIAASGRLPTLT